MPSTLKPVHPPHTFQCAHLEQTLCTVVETGNVASAIRPGRIFEGMENININFLGRERRSWKALRSHIRVVVQDSPFPLGPLAKPGEWVSPARGGQPASSPALHCHVMGSRELSPDATVT